MNCSEEKQTEILSNCTVCQQEQGQDDSAEPSSAAKSINSAAQKVDICFHRVGSGFRALIKKKQVPMGILSHLENELITFFSDWPTSVYISQLPNGYERLILHALCQYLDLVAQSFGGKSGRETRVENRHQVFNTPPVLLTQFLEKNFQL